MIEHWTTLSADLNPSQTGTPRRILSPGHQGSDPKYCAVCKVAVAKDKEAAQVRSELQMTKGKLKASEQKLQEALSKLRTQLSPAELPLDPKNSRKEADPKKLTFLDAALLYVERAGKAGPVTRAEVAMVAWRDDPYRFGLRGFETVSSDAHILSKYLTLHFQAGNLKKPYQGLYELTGRGKAALRALHQSARQTAQASAAEHSGSADSLPGSQPEGS